MRPTDYQAPSSLQYEQVAIPKVDEVKTYTERPRERIEIGTLRLKYSSQCDGYGSSIPAPGFSSCEARSLVRLLALRMNS